MFNLSVIVPIYNEKNIVNSVVTLHDYLSKLKEINYFQIVLVNDGSSDDSLVKCKKLINSFTRITLVTYDKNCGKGYAFNQGVRNSTEDLILFMDADLSVSLNEIPKFLEASNKYDVVVASRNLDSSEVSYGNRARKYLHVLSSKFIKSLFNLPITDSQCGFKLFHRNVIEQFINLQEIYRFAFDVELLQFIISNGYSIKELGVKWNSNFNSSVRPFTDSFRFLVDLAKIKIHKKEGGLIERRI